MNDQWQTYACAQPGVDPDLWFSEEPEDEHQAKKVCQGCYFQLDCRNTAIKNREEYGVWGGMSPFDRRKLSIPRIRVRCPHCETPHRELPSGRPTVCVQCGTSWETLSMEAVLKTDPRVIPRFIREIL